MILIKTWANYSTCNPLSYLRWLARRKPTKKWLYLHTVVGRAIRQDEPTKRALFPTMRHRPHKKAVSLRGLLWRDQSETETVNSLIWWTFKSTRERRTLNGLSRILINIMQILCGKGRKCGMELLCFALLVEEKNKTQKNYDQTNELVFVHHCLFRRCIA